MLSQTELDYSIIECKFLAMEQAILSKLPYIRVTSFKVKTDHNSL